MTYTALYKISSDLIDWITDHSSFTKEQLNNAGDIIIYLDVDGKVTIEVEAELGAD